ncbi:hypothetical protein Leryth_016062 [Lithospermum erythrorhizon]|nr:hypothetical protein Leryth_016062 [Lithospermum erythrorhizon]
MTKKSIGLVLHSLVKPSNILTTSLASSLHTTTIYDHINRASTLSNKIPTPNVYFYTKMIAGYTQNYQLLDALKLFDKMPVKDIVAWNLMIKGCFDCGNLGMGLKLFNEMPERSVVSWTTTMNGLFKFGKVEEAESLFWGMPIRDVAAWNSMIYGYFGHGRVHDAVRLFERMPERNVISWTSMISGLDQHQRSDDALSVFRKMVALGIETTSSTYSSVLTACARLQALKSGVQVHAKIVKFGYLYDVYITASLITFYANCKLMEESCQVFNEKPLINVVVWTSLLTGYSLNDKHEDALSVFQDMVRTGIIPNQSTFTSALNSCCEIEAADMGKIIHGTSVKVGLDVDVFIGNTLITFYCGCGNISEGIHIFRGIKERNIVSWNSIIVGCAQHGCGRWALAFFCQMLRSVVTPDDITFTGLLSACSHSGLLEKGRHFFEYLDQCKYIEVKMEHYACMVDILSRGGKLKEAVGVVKSMPMKANISIWLSILNGCRMHSNLEVAENVAGNIFEIDPRCTGAYVCLSNIYALDGRWSEVARIRGEMKRKGSMKQPGCSWVTQKGVRHTFVSGDKSHPLREKIYEKLDWLREKLKAVGYVPHGNLALHDVEDEQKEVILSQHSERLAICFALITSPVGSSTITVMKNLRVCSDCHSAMKLIAKIVEREIVLRDSSRFHHFRDGFCSCGDYW